MPFRMRVQPVNANGAAEEQQAMTQVPTSRLMRLFERPFSLRNLACGESSLSRGNSGEFEPSSVCLREMVERYMEDPDNENETPCAVRNRMNCFSGSGTDDSSDEEDAESCKPLRYLKSLVRCVNISERDLMTSATGIFENENMYYPKYESKLQIIANELVFFGYDAAVCKSKWEKTKLNSCTCPPAGEYEYLDVMIGGERVLIDIDFQSKFEIARPTKTYKKISQTLPKVFVGQVDRLKRIVTVVSKAAKQSMKKKGLLMPPWRRPEFVLAKWVSPHVRANQAQAEDEPNGNNGGFKTSLGKK
ncbi:hypothetical protein V5N11_036105 [Cardamine amara subsp. amara]|uniref:DUF506 family protein n=1 Tax=Cardamine amara subsp. amara TaxID=228776 RepID=A0ABD1B0M9_CARAN